MQVLFFVAILPPEAIQQELRQIQIQIAQTYGVRGALRSPPHITLVPPFSLASPVSGPPEAIDALQAKLAALASHQAPLPLQLRGFAAFVPRVIYVHVTPTPALLQLQASLQEHFPPRPRAPGVHRFVPHITVAFRDLSPVRFHQIWPEYQGRSLQLDFTALGLTLLRHRPPQPSTQIPSPASLDGLADPNHRWEAIATFPFQPAPLTSQD